MRYQTFSANWLDQAAESSFAEVVRLGRQFKSGSLHLEDAWKSEGGLDVDRDSWDSRTTVVHLDSLGRHVRLTPQLVEPVGASLRNFPPSS
jgi:hypothetical protein